jgi:DNA-binding transcriptional ArsR family regulator
LRRRGLVKTSKQGKFVYYTVADPSVLTLMGTLYEIYCKPAKKTR